MIRTLAAVALLILAAPGAARADDDADRAAGQRVFNQCRACHTVDQGGRSGVGPNLHGLFGRTAGTVQGFRYSDSMRERGAGGLVWNAETLNAYVTSPRAVVPNGSMVFAGIRNPKQVSDLVAYLRHATGSN